MTTTTRYAARHSAPARHCCQNTAVCVVLEWPDKEQKELGVVEELIGGLRARGGLNLSNLRPHRPDPPDCVCTDDDGNTVAVEVSEVVCESAVSRNARGANVYRVWRAGELAEVISARLTEKDNKTFHGGPFDSIVICLFTDEPALTYEAVSRELGPHSFGPLRQVSAAYLLFSYDPGTRTYPFIRLPLAA